MGIRAGDRILTVAGTEIDSGNLYIHIGTRPNRDVALTLLLTVVLKRDVRPGAGPVRDLRIGVMPDVHRSWVCDPG